VAGVRRDGGSGGKQRYQGKAPAPRNSVQFGSPRSISLKKADGTGLQAGRARADRALGWQREAREIAGAKPEDFAEVLAFALDMLDF
jgi:hypothetical protein